MKLVLYFEQRKTLTNILLCLDGFFIDALSIFAIVCWIFKPDVYSVSGVGAFYIIRAVGMHVSKFPKMEHSFFKFDYPSIFVPDEDTNDLYYSGHVGVLVCLM